MIQSTYKGLPYLLLDPPGRTPICTIALYVDLRNAQDPTASPAALRQTLRALWRSEERNRAEMVYYHTDEDLLILFRSLQQDKVTLDAQLDTVSRFFNAEITDLSDARVAQELNDFLDVESKSDPSYAFQDLIDYHVLSKHSKQFPTIPPRVPFLDVSSTMRFLRNSPTALICVNGTEERCRYIIKRLWADRPTLKLPKRIDLKQPIRNPDPAQPLSYDYSWPQCKQTTYSATLWSSESDNSDFNNCLALLLGGGYAFSSGGPGKGLFSRFHQKVLPINGVQCARGVNLNSRYCGFEISATSGASYHLAHSRCYQIMRDLVEHGPTNTELSRTKKKLLFEINEKDPIEIARLAARKILPNWPTIITDDERRDRVQRMTKQSCIRSLESLLSKPCIQVKLGP